MYLSLERQHLSSLLLIQVLHLLGYLDLVPPYGDVPLLVRESLLQREALSSEALHQRQGCAVLYFECVHGVGMVV